MFVGMRLALSTTEYCGVSAIFVPFNRAIWPMLLNGAYGGRAVRREWLNVVRTLERGRLADGLFRNAAGSGGDHDGHAHLD